MESGDHETVESLKKHLNRALSASDEAQRKHQIRESLQILERFENCNE